MRLLMIILVASAMIGLDPARRFRPSSPDRRPPTEIPKPLRFHSAISQSPAMAENYQVMEELGSTLWIAPNWVHVY